MMNEKQKQSMNNSVPRRLIDDKTEQNQNSQCQRLIPVSYDSLTSSRIVSHKSHRISTVHEQIDPIFHNQHFVYNPDFVPQLTTATTTRKRSVQDEYYIQENDLNINKRPRYEHSNNIELENQPPRATIKRGSLFLYHSRNNSNNLQIQNENPSSFNHLLSSISTYDQINNATLNHEYQPNRTNHYCPCHLNTNHRTDQHFSMFGNDTLMTSTEKSAYPKSSMGIIKNNLCLLSSPQMNLHSPLRTTNFVLDNKQQTMSATVMRTGNISPAHSDTSTESTSTCSSDEQQIHQNFSSYNFYLHHQPSRSYRERENYEQLLDLAEKLSDPNRFNKVDVEKFISYRYKSISTTDMLNSKQTACVICMSHFKHGQRIRVLPCHHEYHSKCIARWFSMNSSCPICRRDNFPSTC